MFGELSPFAVVVMFGELSFLFVPDYLGVFLLHFHKCFLFELS